MNSLQKKMDKICKSVENKSKINYATLKDVIELEDWFFDVVVKETCEKNNIKMKFIGEYLCLEKGSDNSV